MSGGHLVVLDRAGREVKKYDLPSGSVILGSDPSCDIRIMLSSVRPHHATVLVHDNQSVIRNVGSGETLLNGVSVSVAALRQEDIVSVGGRELRWRYTNPAPHHARRRPDSPALQSGRTSRASRGTRKRKSEGARLHLPHVSHRDSAPGAISTRQVAIVQPQRRDTADHIDSLSNSAISIVSNVRRRSAKSDSEMETSLNKSINEVMNKSKSPKTTPINLQNTTKATLWIESRKSSPRKSLQEIPTRVLITPKKTFSAKKSTPLRMAVLKKAQSAQKMRVTKIQAPLTIDHTKQAAIMLMTGHTPKQKSTSGRKASLVVTKRPRGRSSKSSISSTRSMRGSSTSDSTLRSGSKASLDLSPSVMEISDSDTAQSTIRESDVSQQSERLSRASIRSPTASPIKSALKDPRKSTRKTESIKFDLSNLDEPPSSPEERDVRLRYSESPTPQPINSRAREILRRTLGSDENIASNTSSSPVLAASPSSPRLARGSLMLQRALRSTSPNKMESYSIVDLVSADSTSSLYGSASDTSRYNSPTNSGRATRRNLIASTPAVPKMSRSRSAITSTSYDSIRDDSQMTYCSDVSRRSKSLSTPAETQNGTYDISKKKSQSPVNAENDYVTFNISRRSRQSLVTADISKENITEKKSLPTDENTTATLDDSTKSRRTRSTLTGENDIENITLDSIKSRSQSRSQMSDASMTSTRNKSKSESPNNDIENITLNSTKSRAHSRSQISDASITSARNKSKSESPKHDGTSTPKNQNSPEEAGTPVLSIQSLLDSDQNATLLRQSKKNSTTKVLKRKTIGGRLSVPKKRGSIKSKSLRLSTRISTRSRGSNISNISPISSDSTEEVSQDDQDTTPKSAVKLVQEAVKNKHSTAKKPKSKRSIIDNLNDSDIVKQLFNSPVKRKLSQSMIEYSRKQNLDEERPLVKRSTRKTFAFGDKSPDNSVMEQSQAITPERFVSPLSTPSNSPNVVGVKRLFAKSTPENDLRNVRGVKKLLQTPRPRRSVRNDLTEVSGVKSVFARSPKNRLSDVRIKEVFAVSPNNDLRRVSGVKSLFQTEKKNKSPKNDLSDVANVRTLYKRNSSRNDLGNISGVKRAMRRNSPRNDLGDVRGVRKLFHLEKQPDDLNDISGIEELFSESHHTSNVTDANSESSFNLLIGKPAVRSYGSKAKSFSLKTIQKPKNRKAKSLQNSFSSISNNVEDWLENELRKRMHKDDENNATSTKKSSSKSKEENMFDSTSNSNNSSSIISRSMSRSKRILELSMSERKGKKSTINNTNVTVNGNKSKINVSNFSVNKSKTNETSRKNMSSSRNETAKSNFNFTGDDGDISTGNVTQFDSSSSSNTSRTNRTTPRKNVSRSQNKTVNNSDIIEGDDQLLKGNETHFDASSTSVNISKTPKELTLRKSLNRSKNKTTIDISNIHVEDNQISKENETQFVVSSTSVNKSETPKELTLRKSLNRSRNKSAVDISNIHVEDDQMSKENETQFDASSTSVNKSKTPKELTLRKSMNRSRNKTAIDNSNIHVEDDQISKENETQLDASSTSVNKSKTPKELTLRKSMNRSKNKNAIDNSNVHVEDDHKSKENETQFDASSTSVNKSKTPKELTLRKSMNRSRNKTAIDNSNVHVEDDHISKEKETQFHVSSTSVNKSKTPKELTLRKSMNRSRNKTAIDNSNVHVEDDQISKENETQFEASSTSVNKSKPPKELTLRKSMNRSRNKTAVSNVEDDQISQGDKTQFKAFNKSCNKSAAQNEVTPRKSIDRSKNKTAINNVEDSEISQTQTSNKSKVLNEVTPRKSLNKSKNKTPSNIVEANEISKVNASNTSTNHQRTQSVETPSKSATKSKNKTNRSRELLKLATDTVDGNTPLLTTRVRNSTLIKSTSDEGETKKPTSEIYSAHTLPIKKRSLLDRDTSGNINKDTSGNKSEKSVLPIKKRAVVHSTPVKGRLNLTMNTTEIGRVSPIASVIEVTIDEDDNPTTRNTEVSKISPRRRLLQARSYKVAPGANANTEAKSPAPVRATRRKTKQSLDVNKVKKRKSSIVITKKTPVLSPKAPTNVSTNVPLVTESVEPNKKTRGRRTRDQNILQADTDKEVPIPKKGRKATLEVQIQKVGNESPKAKPNIEKDKEASISQQPSEESVPKARKTRGHKVATEKVSPPKKLTRTKASKESVGKKEQIIPENNAKQSESEAETNVNPRRGRKPEANKVDAKEPETGKRSTRGAGQKNPNENIEMKSKKVVTEDSGIKDSSKTADSGSSENSSRGRKRKIAVEESPPNVKKSKANDINSKKSQKIVQKPTESKQSTRGRQTNLESSENIDTLKEPRTRRGRVTETVTTEVSNKRVSGRKAESKIIQTETAEASKRTTGKKEECDKIIDEVIEVKRHGRKKQPETAEIQSEQNITESKRTRRGEGDAVKVNEKTKPETEVKTTRRQKAKEPENIEATGKSRQKVNEPEKTEAKGKSRQKMNEPEKTEAKGRSRQKVNEPEETEAKGRIKQKMNEPEKIEAKGKSRQKVNEPEEAEAKGRSRQKVNEPEKTEAKGKSRQKVNEPEEIEAKGRSRQKVNEPEETEAKGRSRQKVNKPEKAEVTGKSRQKVNEPEVTEAKGRTRRKVNEPENTEAKGKSRQKASEEEKTEAKAKSQKAESKSKQKVSEPEKTEVKTTKRQKVIEPEITQVTTTRRQKTTEPEKTLAGRKRKNDSDSSTAKESAPPSKTRKTQPVSPKAKRTRSTKVEEPQKPAGRSRRR